MLLFEITIPYALADKDFTSVLSGLQPSFSCKAVQFRVDYEQQIFEKFFLANLFTLIHRKMFLLIFRFVADV